MATTPAAPSSKPGRRKSLTKSRPRPPASCRRLKEPPISKVDLLKANEILSHPADYIEERVTLMLAEVPGYHSSVTPTSKPDPASLARLINPYIVAKLKL